MNFSESGDSLIREPILSIISGFAFLYPAARPGLVYLSNDVGQLGEVTAGRLATQERNCLIYWKCPPQKGKKLQKEKFNIYDGLV